MRLNSARGTSAWCHPGRVSPHHNGVSFEQSRIRDVIQTEINLLVHLMYERVKLRSRRKLRKLMPQERVSRQTECRRRP